MNEERPENWYMNLVRATLIVGYNNAYKSIQDFNEGNKCGNCLDQEAYYVRTQT